MIPKTIDYEPSSNRMIINSYLQVDWTDEHLRWNPDDFDNIHEIHVQHDEIWIPDLSVWNSADLNSVMIFSSKTSCLVMYNGLIICVPFIETSVHCSSDFENWPFEKQICKIIFSSYFHFNEEINLNYTLDKVVMHSLQPHQEWSIVNTTVSSRLDLFILPRVIYEFQLKRHSRVIITLYFIPLIVLMIFTLIILWMDINSTERIAFIGLNFLCHLLCLFDLQWQITENGNRIPYLLVLYEGSLSISAFNLIMTIILRKLNTITTSSKWISSIAAYVLKYKIGRLFVLDDIETKCFVDNEEDEDDNNLQYISKSTPNNIWKYFAKILQCLSFFSIFLTYIIMFLSYASM
ncbi:neuronal acetylcholine receptor subunit alpha-5-like isoform X2 [Leptopilina boulardi]|nr:neuronal acetylcholine receptor subunit alpha-5-like isoform X2 [Leptopilina boulardi]